MFGRSKRKVKDEYTRVSGYTDPFHEGNLRTIRWLQGMIPSDWPEHMVALFPDVAPAGMSKGFEPTLLEFEAGDPHTLFDWEGGIPFRGQERSKKLLAIKIQAMREHERFKSLLIGTAGTGKTSLAWILADKIIQRRGFGRFFELLPTQIGNLEQFEIFVRGLEEGDVVFIDEVHVLGINLGVEPLLHILADTGRPRLKVGHAEINLPAGVHWIAATTDPGSLDHTTGGALRRRFNPIIHLEKPNVDTMVDIMHDREPPIEKRAAYEIAERSFGLVWQALEYFKTARDYARVAGQEKIEMPHVVEAMHDLGVDENGLTSRDRSIIRAIIQNPKTLASGAVAYSMSESAVCAIAGIDVESYKREVQPKLMAALYLLPQGGQRLTDRALFTYGHLKR